MSALMGVLIHVARRLDFLGDRAVMMMVLGELQPVGVRVVAVAHRHRGHELMRLGQFRRRLPESVARLE